MALSDDSQFKSCDILVATSGAGSKVDEGQCMVLTESESELHEHPPLQEDASVGAQVATAGCISASVIHSTPQTTRDWHKEILFGLFLRSDERELLALANQKDDGGGWMEMHFLEKESICEESSVKRLALPSFEYSLDPSVLTLIPEALRGYPFPAALLSKPSDAFISSSKPLLGIPTKWKREDLASRSLLQLEEEVFARFQNSSLCQTRIGAVLSTSASKAHNDYKQKHNAEITEEAENIVHTPGWSQKHHAEITEEAENIVHAPGWGQEMESRKPLPEDPNLFEPFLLMYNECTLAALSRWASKSPSDTHNKEAEEKLRTLDIHTFNRPAASPTFRCCSICDKWGHYDIECERVQEKDLVRSLAPETKVQRTLRGFIEEENISSTVEAKQQAHVWTAGSETAYINQNQISPEALIRLNGAETVEEGDVLMPDAARPAGEALWLPKERIPDPNEDFLIKSTACEFCGSGFRAEDLLLCDGCDCLFHFQCLDPPLESVPEGDWFCNECASYDSDVSSVVELEACEGFVVEQRKRSMAQDDAAAQRADLGLGFPDRGWSSAVGILRRDINAGEQREKWEEELYYERDSVRGDDKVDEPVLPMMQLAAGELCWARRRSAPEGLLGRDDWWPSMVIFVHGGKNARRYRGKTQTPYVVKFFSLQGAGRVRASDVLPFFPHYEELGHNRLSDVDQRGYVDFRKALEEATAEIGCGTLSHALKKAKEISANGAKQDAQTELENRPLSPTLAITSKYATKVAGTDQDDDVENGPGAEMGQGEFQGTVRRPSAWDDADVVKVDGFAIFAKRKKSEVARSDITTDAKSVSQKSNVLATTSSATAVNTGNIEIGPDAKMLTTEDTKNRSEHVRGHLNAISREIECAVPAGKIIGSLVAWPIKKNHQGIDSRRTDTPTHFMSNTRSKFQLGVALAINAGHRKALVRSLPQLEDFSPLSFSASVVDNNSEYDKSDDTWGIFSCSVAPSFWVKIESLKIVADKPTRSAVESFRSKLDSSLESERRHLLLRQKAEATHREENMIELVALPNSEEQCGGHSNNFSHTRPPLDGKHNVARVKRKRAINGEITTRVDVQSSKRVPSPFPTYSTPSQSANGKSNDHRRRQGVNGEDIFQVDQILDERLEMQGNTLTKEYLVKWKGFEVEDSTWEPENNILNQRFVDMYKAQNLADRLKETTEGQNSNSLTFRIIRALENGRKRIANGGSSVQSTNSKWKICPFCGSRFAGGSALGGHVKTHAYEANYLIIREASKFIHEDWYEI